MAKISPPAIPQLLPPLGWRPPRLSLAFWPDFEQFISVMLRIGKNQYELVRVNSGFTAYSYQPIDELVKQDQCWILELHYVPMEGRYTPRADGKLEYLNVQFRAEEYSVTDWRQLSGLGLDTADDCWMGTVSVKNLMVAKYTEETWLVTPGWLEVEHQHDYLFQCKFDGIFKRDADTEEDMELDDLVPFREAVIHVPINAANPVRTACALAARNLKLSEHAASTVKFYDPSKPSYETIRINTHHEVSLTTPWLEQLV